MTNSEKEQIKTMGVNGNGVDMVYRTKLEDYLASMMQAKKMFNAGIITAEDFQIITTMMDKKYGISLCSIYRGLDLLYRGAGGNMAHYKEVN